VHRKKIFFVKFIHIAIFIFLAICLFYILYCAISRTYDWTLLTAIGAIAINGMSILFNHFECPLTTLAKKYGDPKGSVTDIIMPAWCARNVFKFFIALLAIELIWLGTGYFT